jgi:thioredoxin reductase (NADPH)
MQTLPFDVIVIGEGIAGLTAAGIAARAGLRVASLEAMFPGGLVANIIELDPGPSGPASGAELAGDLVLANARAGVRSINCTVLGLELQDGGTLRVLTSEGPYEAVAVIVASGARLRPLGVADEAAYHGRGLSMCADCDGPLFNGEDVVVAGGGDSALQEALILASICRKVVIVHDREHFSACDELVAKVLATPSIHVLARSRVIAIEGRDGVEAVQVRADDGGPPVRIACRGVFPFVGLVPVTDFLPAEVMRDEHGAVRAGAAREASVPNLLAIGAARAGFPGRLDDAIRDAEIAANALLASRRAALGVVVHESRME